MQTQAHQPKARARRTDPRTSHMAATVVTPRLPFVQGRIYRWAREVRERIPGANSCRQPAPLLVSEA